MSIRNVNIIAITLACTCLQLRCIERSMAHDFTPAPNSKVEWQSDRLAYMPIDRGLNSPVPKGSSAPYYVILLPNKWAQSQVVHVCFKGGSEELRKKILSIAQSWIPYTNLKIAPGLNGFDCAAKDKSEVRIGFNEPGYWSYFGNDSMATELILKDLSSMNLQGFDRAPPAEPDFTGIVLHEWGHALGLHHEHQSPAGGCDSHYIWPKVYEFYKKTYGWEKDKVDMWVRQLATDHNAYDWSTTLDRQSIMIYASYPDLLKDGVTDTCCFQANFTLSKSDKEGISRAYPPTNPGLALSLQTNSLPAVLELDLDPDFKRAINTQLELATKWLLERQ